MRLDSFHDGAGPQWSILHSMEGMHRGERLAAVNPIIARAYQATGSKGDTIPLSDYTRSGRSYSCAIMTFTVIYHIQL